MKAIVVSRRMRAALARYATAVAKRGGEAVALVLVVDDEALRFIPVPNEASDKSCAFELSVDDDALCILLAKAGLEIVLFHSHVRGDAYPSASDRRYAEPGERHLIYSVELAQLRCFTFESTDDDRVRSGLLPIELAVLDLPNVPVRS